MAAEPMQAEIRARVEAAEIHRDPFPNMVVKQVPSYLEDDRLADPAARERWARYVAERREAEAAAER